MSHISLSVTSTGERLIACGQRFATRAKAVVPDLLHGSDGIAITTRLGLVKCEACAVTMDQLLEAGLVDVYEYNSALGARAFPWVDMPESRGYQGLRIAGPMGMVDIVPGRFCKDSEALVAFDGKATSSEPIKEQTSSAIGEVVLRLNTNKTKFSALVVSPGTFAALHLEMSASRLHLPVPRDTSDPYYEEIEGEEFYDY